MTASNGICAVCSIDFSKILGGRGIRVLQVHHQKQLSMRMSPAITKVSDLVVVCANCHLLLHLDSEHSLSVAELRRMLRSDNSSGRKPT
jgi:predicted HNH restriction endonuclease